jgi:hypothetical protein
MARLVVASFAFVFAAAPLMAGPPAGVPAGAGGQPAFAGSGRPDFAGSSASASARGSSASSNAASSARGSSASSSAFPSNANAGGSSLSHGSATAQPTLQLLDQAFSEGEISAIREYFTTRAHANKPEGESSTTYKKGQKLTAGYLAEPLPADLLAKLPNRPGLTYVRVGDDILLLAGPDDVIVDIIPGAGATSSGS